ncbi:MAG: ArsR/SmtB family transcription factor [Clostridia bacterium]|jgi:predicted transcriptional regulator
MNIQPTEEFLPIYEALASKVRLNIIQLLAQQPMNIKELAEALNLSSAIMTMHVRKLEAAGLISASRERTGNGVQKICKLKAKSITIEFPMVETLSRNYHEVIIPVGHYTDCDIKPTCGLATPEKLVGYYDDPRYFMDPERVNARILWFSQGYVEYKIPNYLLKSQEPEELEISMELGLEAPGYNNDWPSEISFFINGIHVGNWTSPGDFGGQRGKYTPPWWCNTVNQYGLLKALRITRNGTYMDGTKISDIPLHELDMRQKYWSFRIAVLEDARHIGGLTLYGKGFGNYDQDIVVKLYYK